MKHAEQMSVPVPSYAELPLIDKTGDRHSWDYFGRDDQLGTLNFSTPESRLRGRDAIRTGQVINLSLPVTADTTTLVPSREAPRHVKLKSRGSRDDYIDNYFLQGSSQWDGLNHIRYREFGFFGGRSDDDIDAGELGMDILAEHGMTGRGVLLDLAQYFADTGRSLDPTKRYGFTASDLNDVVEYQSAVVEPGDFLTVRTGWMSWYTQLSPEERRELAGSLNPGETGLECPGLDPSAATAKWLWNHQIAAVAADNPGVEAFKVRKDEGFLHRRLIALLGMPLGELWDVEKLAAHCRETGNYDFLLTSGPMRLPGGAGSPANAFALV